MHKLRALTVDQFATVAILILIVVHQGMLSINRSTNEDAFDADMITEDSLHVQMEFIFGPSFEALKEQIGTESEGEVDWPTVRQHALIISETLSRLHRWPDIKEFENEEKRAKYVEYWKENGIPDTKKSAHELYELASNKSLDDSKAMLAQLANNCNVCHKRAGSWSPVVIKP